MMANLDAYTYKELTTNDKTFIDGFDKAVEEMSEGCEEYIVDRVCADYEDADSVSGKMKREIISEALTILWRLMDDTRRNIIISMIDGYDDE